MYKTLTSCFFLVTLLCLLGCQTQEETPIDLTELTISDIHAAYADGRFNSQQLVQAYLDRIEQNDSLINAITTINPEALAIARALDEEYERTGVLRPLHGIPLLVKDNINTAGLPTTAGALALKDFVPEEDAFIIKKLVDAGAIVLAKTNMAEWAFSPRHTESSTAGTTHNPYNTDYVPAGSSGGTGAAMAANFATIGLGTDTGNSIRGPSSHCALVGFRTTLGLVSRSAIVPLYLRNDVVGPMCRTVEDATRVLDVIAGYDPDDPITSRSDGKIPENYTSFLRKDGLQGARIGVLRELSEADPDPQVKELFEKALKDLEAAGAELIDPLVVPGFDSLRRDQWCPMFAGDLADYLVTYVKRDTLESIDDVIRIGTNSEYARNGLSYMSDARESMKNLGPRQCADPYTDTRRMAFRQAIEHQMDSLQLDALVYPSWNNRPAHIDAFNEEYKGDNNQVIAPHTGQPAFTVPMGYTEGNLPAGLQFLGRMFSEGTLISLCYAYEQATHHRKPALESASLITQ
ncbi:MAG: amidase family protein [Saprospiraceae bacterium]